MKALLLIILSAAVLSGADNVLTAQEKSAGWILLFDGKTLTGWEPFVPAPPASPAAAATASKTAPGGAPAQGSHPRPCATASNSWEIVGGSILPCGATAGYLASKQTWQNFTLAIDFKTGEDTNSGVFVRSPEGIRGYEVQIWKAQPAGYNTGSIVNAGRTSKEYKFKPDVWNHYEITADGDHLVVVLNGITTLDIHDRQFTEGRILLQYQKFPIEFKNIKLNALSH